MGVQVEILGVGTQLREWETCAFGLAQLQVQIPIAGSAVPERSGEVESAAACFGGADAEGAIPAIGEAPLIELQGSGPRRLLPLSACSMQPDGEGRPVESQLLAQAGDPVHRLFQGDRPQGFPAGFFQQPIPIVGLQIDLDFFGAQVGDGETASRHQLPETDGKGGVRTGDDGGGSGGIGPADGDAADLDRAIEHLKRRVLHFNAEAPVPSNPWEDLGLQHSLESATEEG